jgi:hypothetical protein
MTEEDKKTFFTYLEGGTIKEPEDDLPETVRAFAIFPFGYPSEQRKQQDRFDESRIHYVE